MTQAADIVDALTGWYGILYDPIWEKIGFDAWDDSCGEEDAFWHEFYMRLVMAQELYEPITDDWVATVEDPPVVLRGLPPRQTFHGAPIITDDEQATIDEFFAWAKSCHHV